MHESIFLCRKIDPYYKFKDFSRAIYAWRTTVPRQKFNWEQAWNALSGLDEEDEDLEWARRNKRKRFSLTAVRLKKLGIDYIFIAS